VLSSVEMEVEAWGASGWMTWPKSLNPEASAVVGRFAMEARLGEAGREAEEVVVGRKVPPI
jgi:hypothetical protein